MQIKRVALNWAFLIFDSYITCEIGNGVMCITFLCEFEKKTNKTLIIIFYDILSTANVSLEHVETDYTNCSTN